MTDAAQRPSGKTLKASGAGNRVWRVETEAGPVVQKLFRERSGRAKLALQSLFQWSVGCKTLPWAHSRWQTERDTLAIWRQHGCDVPRDLSADDPALGIDKLLVLEFVPGPTLAALLGSPRLGTDRRLVLLAQFAGAWCRRHRLALDHGEPRLVQEHGTLAHVIVSGKRLVTIDLEQSYRASSDPAPLIAKEIVSYLTSLTRWLEPQQFREDLVTIVDAYPEREILDAAVREYLHSPSPLRRMLWRIERSLLGRQRHSRRKYRVIRELADALAQVNRKD